MKAALEAARNRDWAACLSALLVEWCATKDPALAALIETVGAIAPAEPIPEVGVGNAITERMQQATDADVTAILAAIVRGTRTMPNLHGAAVKLANMRAPDPRIAATLAHFVENPPFKRTDGALYPDVIEALDAIDDPRFRALIVESWERIEPRMRYLRKDKKAALILKDIAAAVAKREQPPQVDAWAIVEIEQLLAAKTPAQKKQAGDTSSLLQAIYDDPLDTSLRLVYADALQEAGDPRGELIALQCNRGAGPITKRERELLKLYGRTWLGAIDPVVLKSGVEYRRGFVAKAREAVKKTVQQKLLASPEWSTVEELELTVSWAESARTFLADPRWKALRVVWHVMVEDLLAIAKRRTPYPWTTIALRSGWRPVLADLDAFPSLERLKVYDAEAVPILRALSVGPLGRSLRRVQFPLAYAQGPNVPRILAAARDAGIAEVEWAHEWYFAGDSDGAILRIANDHATCVFQTSSIDFGVISTFIANVPTGTIRTVAFELPPRTMISDTAWQGFCNVLRMNGIEMPARP